MADEGNTFWDAFLLVASFDADLYEIIWLSLQVSLSALAIACFIGIPLGSLLASTRFPGRTVINILLNAMMGLPPVVVGLILYLMLSNSGPLGVLQLLYTPGAMIIAQAVLVTPIVAALARQSLVEMHEEYEEQFQLFGLTRFEAIRTLIWEARYSLLTAILAGFGRAIAEVGAVLIVGGNIDHLTRVMTTTIALETSRGNLAIALGLGIVLILISLTVNVLLYAVRATASRSRYA
ncbi:MAG: ABC transporter permease [Salaquimonas sp.]